MIFIISMMLLSLKFVMFTSAGSWLDYYSVAYGQLDIETVIIMDTYVYTGL